MRLDSQLVSPYRLSLFINTRRDALNQRLLSRDAKLVYYYSFECFEMGSQNRPNRGENKILRRTVCDPMRLLPPFDRVKKQPFRILISFEFHCIYKVFLFILCPSGFVPQETEMNEHRNSLPPDTIMYCAS